jgi:hypothetical protein
MIMPSVSATAMIDYNPEAAHDARFWKNRCRSKGALQQGMTFSQAATPTKTTGLYGLRKN